MGKAVRRLPGKKMLSIEKTKECLSADTVQFNCYFGMNNSFCFFMGVGESMHFNQDNRKQTNCYVMYFKRHSMGVFHTPAWL